MPVDGENHRGPLIVGVSLRQHPEVVSQAAFLAERLGRTIVFVFVEPRSSLAAWNLTIRMTDLPVPPPEIAEDMSDEATELFTAIGALMAGSQAAWILRIAGGETWVALGRLADEVRGSMFVVGDPGTEARCAPVRIPGRGRGLPPGGAPAPARGGGPGGRRKRESLSLKDPGRGKRARSGAREAGDGRCRVLLGDQVFLHRQFGDAVGPAETNGRQLPGMHQSVDGHLRHPHGQGHLGHREIVRVFEFLQVNHCIPIHWSAVPNDGAVNRCTLNLRCNVKHM